MLKMLKNITGLLEKGAFLINMKSDQQIICHKRALACISFTFSFTRRKAGLSCNNSLSQTNK